MLVDLYTKQLGIPTGQTLVFLHGLFGNHRNLLPIARKFEHRFNIVLTDLRNHGQSPHHDVITYQSMCEDVHHLISNTHNQKAIIIGHSMGGKVAMLHALNYPEQTQGIFILDIAPVNYEFQYTPVVDNLLNIELAKLESREQADNKLSKHYKNEEFRQFLLQNLIRTNNQYQWRLNLQAIKQNHSHIRQFPSENYSAYLKPSFFLAGSESEYVTSQYEEKMRDLFPSHTLQYLPQTSHWLHAEKPQQVCQKIEHFLQSIKELG